MLSGLLSVLHPSSGSMTNIAAGEEEHGQNAAEEERRKTKKG